MVRRDDTVRIQKKKILDSSNDPNIYSRTYIKRFSPANIMILSIGRNRKVYLLRSLQTNKKTLVMFCFFRSFSVKPVCHYRRSFYCLRVTGQVYLCFRQYSTTEDRTWKGLDPIFFKENLKKKK